MSFKSHAQREHCLERVRKGEISRKQFDEYDKKTDHKNLPPRVGEPKKTTLGAKTIPKPTKK